MVGLGRIELPTSPLSGVRSSRLSYRPLAACAYCALPSWWSWSGSNRRPPECKSGALPAELQPLQARRASQEINRGRLDAGLTRPARVATLTTSKTLSKSIRNGLDWNGYSAVHCAELQPRSL